jgi:DNA-binding CsgD family transcriptional regulator
VRGVDVAQIGMVVGRLGEAALEPRLWPDIMEQVSRLTGSTGAVLFQSDVRTPDAPRTAGVDEMVTNYFRNGWHTRDLRATRGVPRMLSGHLAVTDQDLVTADEMRHAAYYNEMLLPYGFRWFAGIGFWSASALWALCLQRTEREGPFEDADKRFLSALSSHLTEAATFSAAIGQQVVTGAVDALGLVGTAALVIDRLAAVIAVNRAAEELFDDDLRVSARHLVLRDLRASATWNQLTARLRLAAGGALQTPASLVARRRGKSPVLIRVVSIPPAAGSPFLGARVLVTLAEAEPLPSPEVSTLSQLFGLTLAEAKLAGLVAIGTALPQAASRLGISHQTARNQLKAVFAKTDTHRQAELVALLAVLR